MKYIITFILLIIVFSGVIIAGRSPLRFMLLWPILTCAFYIAAYALNKPELIMNKNAAGQISPPLFLINLPWLVLTWIIWYAYVMLLHEPTYHHIDGTNLTIGRRLKRYQIDFKFDIIIDMTCDFVETYQFVTHSGYVCFPTLDAREIKHEFLEPLQTLIRENTDKRFYIHCAQGHGRAAVAGIIYLIETHVADNVQQAFDILKTHRPLVRLTKTQRGYLESIYNKR